MALLCMCSLGHKRAQLVRRALLVLLVRAVLLALRGRRALAVRVRRVSLGRLGLRAQPGQREAGRLGLPEPRARAVQGPPAHKV